MQTLLLDKANAVRLSAQDPTSDFYQPETIAKYLSAPDAKEAIISTPAAAQSASQAVDHTAPRRPGRPSRPPLTEALIGQAALEIIDERDWASCTMKALAQRLGVRAPSLYHHVNGQRAIVDLVRKLVVRKIHDPSILELPAAEAMWKFGIAYYRAFAQHPNTIQVLSTTPVRDRETTEMYEVFLQALVRGGWDKQRAFEALLGLEHLALGFAFEWNAEDLMIDSSAAAALDAPLLAEVTRDRTDQVAIAESTYRGLLTRYIAMFEIEINPHFPAKEPS